VLPVRLQKHLIWHGTIQIKSAYSKQKPLLRLCPMNSNNVALGLPLLLNTQILLIGLLQQRRVSLSSLNRMHF
jgi:hypothetical protein